MARKYGRRNRGWLAGRAVVVLLGGSLGAMLLPTSVTGWVSNLVQVLVPFQDGVTQVASVGDEGAAGSDVESLRSMVETLAAENVRLRGDVATLTRVRGRGLGMRGRLIPARVVADDAAFWRGSKLILGGVGRGVSRGEGVLSQHFSVDLSGEDGAVSGMAVLAAEVLIGVVETAGTYTSRVKLLSDPDMRMPVAIGRVEAGSYSAVDASFWLVGQGRGVIEVCDVHHQYVTDGAIKVGDVVLTPGDAVRLPPSVTIGTIVEIERDSENSLLYVLRVEPRVALEKVRRVYVVDRDG